MQPGNCSSVGTVNTKPLGKLFVPLERARGSIPTDLPEKETPATRMFFAIFSKGQKDLEDQAAVSFIPRVVLTAGTSFLSRSHSWKGIGLGLVVLVLASSTKL